MQCTAEVEAESVWVLGLRWGNARPGGGGTKGHEVTRVGALLAPWALALPLFLGGVQTWRTQKERE